MSIEGLGKRFQDARVARGLTLDEAARMTKIRPSRLAEIEADDFSNFPSLAYAKGFLLIYGKFLDVDVTAFMEAFETSEQVTVDGYSYLQDNPAPKPTRTPVVHRSTGNRTSLMPFFIGVVVIVLGFLFMKFILNILRIAPHTEAPAQTQTTSSLPPSTPVVIATPRPAPVESTPARIAEVPLATPTPTLAPTGTPSPTSTPAIALATPKPAPTKEPEVRRAEPVRPEDLTKATGPENASKTTSNEQNQVAIKPLRRTYIKVVVDNEARTPAFERWISPSDGTVEFKGQHIDVRVLDRDAVQIRKNGKIVADGDTDVTIE